jgi:hypothetical protein
MALAIASDADRVCTGLEVEVSVDVLCSTVAFSLETKCANPFRA